MNRNTQNRLRGIFNSTNAKIIDVQKNGGSVDQIQFEQIMETLLPVLERIDEIDEKVERIDLRG